MPISSKYLFIASMNVDQDKEALYNELYDKEHIPFLLTVPSIRSATRFKMRELTMLIGGERRVMRFEKEPKYHTLYELESPDALVSEAFAKANEMGRWPQGVRPYTKNRRHILMER